MTYDESAALMIILLGVVTVLAWVKVSARRNINFLDRED